ncbi:hypothetical protein GL307_10055 [Nocardia seriolae]|uniref:hypothetical protein n=1 Tax=Nocardia seriolae TaxID=37332 RepID=UPI0012BD0C0E|nr:hypothetical protein [Nocardia seriolae]MTL11957.1 hypothetical protein [Nocardia seriolae]
MAHTRRATPADNELDPGFFDREAQRSPAWLAWSDRAAIEARIETLFTDSLPRLEAARGGETRPPVDDRFSEDTFDWVVSLIGEWMVRGVEGIWFNSPDDGAPIFDLFGPAIGYRWSRESANDLLVPLFMMAVNSDDDPFGYFVDLLQGRVLTFAEENTDEFGEGRNVGEHDLSKREQLSSVDCSE